MNELAVSDSKSAITLFTPQFAQSSTQPRLILNNFLLLFEIVGVTFYPHFKLWAHVKSIVTRVSPRINILKAFAGTNWGQQKKTVLITYMFLTRSFSINAAPI